MNKVSPFSSGFTLNPLSSRSSAPGYSLRIIAEFLRISDIALTVFNDKIKSKFADKTDRLFVFTPMNFKYPLLDCFNRVTTNRRMWGLEHLHRSKSPSLV